MPIDLLVEYTDGTTESFYVPLRLMSFEKKSESWSKRTVLNDWTWALIMILLSLKQKYDQENHYRSKRINGWCETGKIIFLNNN
jgi:hypothetical protein